MSRFEDGSVLGNIKVEVPSDIQPERLQGFALNL
jgi:hypothetical protein